MEKIDLNELKGVLEETAKSINIKSQDFINLEKSATDKFMKEIKDFVPHRNYKNLLEYLKIITNSETKINLLVVVGEMGIGKSSVIKSMLKGLKKDFIYLNSFSTALSFYKIVYENRYKHIILDDLTGIFEDSKGISILRALTNTETTRYINYQSTSEKLDVPSSFIFEGSITILTNKITLEMDKSLLGRAITREVRFTLNEKLEFMESIIKFNYNKLNKKELKEITDFIKENVDNTTKNFSFRSMIKIVEFYNHNKKLWKELGIEELEVDEELVFIKGIINLTIEKRNKKWADETGKTIRTLQRKIKELNQTTKRHNDRNAYRKEKGVKRNNG